MKLAVKILAPVVALLATATAVAVAAPTTPFPTVPANADVCKVEKLEIDKQQAEYDFAVRTYDRARRAGRAVSAEELRAAQRAVLLATIKVNNAKYAEATCRNDKGNDPKKVCIALALELNRLIDELDLRRSLESLAIADYNAAVRAGNAVSVQELDRLRTAARVATIERQQSVQRVADQRKKIADTPACKDFESERPSPTSTETETTTEETSETFTEIPTTTEETTTDTSTEITTPTEITIPSTTGVVLPTTGP